MTEDPQQLAPSPEFRAHARVRSRDDYAALHHESLSNPESFWARELADLFSGWSQLRVGDMPEAKWFHGATLNVSALCLDRHLAGPHRHKAALVWEGEPLGPHGQPETRTLTRPGPRLVEAARILARCLGQLPGHTPAPAAP